MSHGNDMIGQPVTLSGYAEWPQVADAVIAADNLIERVACIFIERERYGTCDPPPPLLQRPPSSVLPRSASMALLHPGADRAHAWRGDAPHRKYLSEMYDDDARDAA